MTLMHKLQEMPAPGADEGDGHHPSDSDSSAGERDRGMQPPKKQNKKNKKKSKRKPNAKKTKKAPTAAEIANEEWFSHPTTLYGPSDLANKPPPSGDIPLQTLNIDANIKACTFIRNGVDGVRLFARSPILPGTRLISEEPLMALTAPGDEIDVIYAAHESLSPEGQRAFWNLKGNFQSHEHVQALGQIIDSTLAIWMELHALGDSQDIDEDYAYRMLGIRLCRLIKKQRILSRFHAHRYSLISAVTAEREQIPHDVPITGLFPATSQLVHSCMPNCMAVYNTRSGFMNVHATRPIEPGEGLTVSLIGNHIWYHVAGLRAGLLKEINADLTCNCPACDRSHALFKAHDMIRRRLHLNVVILNVQLTNRDLAAHEGVYRSDILTPIFEDYQSDHLDTESVLRTERFCLETIELLGEAGCEDIEIVRWRNVLRDLVYPALGRVEEAKLNADLAVKLAERFWGDDHQDMEVLRAAKESADREVERKKEEKDRDAALAVAAEMKKRGLI